ncbi:MAG: TlpA family protein disulfide reductase [Flavobacteriales bacterium]|nr:TlpA family protein disulfide reductase [Flavobacteriales bacterium]
MKKLIQYYFLISLFLVLTNCQPVLKAPVATLYSATLSTPVIDSAQIKKYPMADFNLHVSDLDGNPINMENYRGKVIFLNFWATWCMPCVAELPSIDKLYKEFKNENIEFLLISNENPEKVQHYKTKKKYEVPFLIQSSTSQIPQMYYSPGIPTTFIINKEGQLIKASTGAEDWDDKEFITTLKKLL